ncbi:sigma-70 family RNA polymerase sigma factor [bacterium]|nr:sigma-70 family RNA polymerase sigma factor [bacterium]
MQNNERSREEIVSEWLDEYRIARDPFKKAKAKTMIVSTMLPIVKRIAKTIARRSYDPIDDLIQAGSIGLLKAIESFSSDKNDNFKVYAGSLIIGEMKHYLRDKLNTIRVPRHIQELSYRINSFISTLTPEQLDDLTSDFVAEALNVTPKEVDMALQADRRKHTYSLEDVYRSDNDNLGYEEVLASNDYKEKTEIEDTKMLLLSLISKLPEEYKELVELYYHNDLSQKDIAERLELSQMQVSRKLKKAFGLLYEMISKSDLESVLLGAI